MNVRVNVETAELERALAALVRGGAEFVPEATEAAARRVLVPEMRRLAPKDTRGLEKSIVAQEPKRVDGVWVVDVGSFGLPDPRARVQEFGALIKMTDKMRRFLFGVLFKDQPDSGRRGPNPGYVTIPAQPYMRPAWAAKRGELLREITAALREYLGDPGQSVR